MTDCHHEPMLFSNLGRRQVQADFGGGTLTSDTGALLLRQTNQRIGLIDAIDRAIPDPRDPDRIHHTQRSMLAQRIISLALGYEDLNDQQTLRHDPLLQTSADRTPDLTPDAAEPLASPPTLCRLENRVSRATLMKIAAVFVDQFIASYPAPPDEPLILDFDATDDPTHGYQEGHFFHGYYDHDCFLPLYVFCGDQLLVSYLRPSNIDGSKHAWAILKLLVGRLRAAWPGVKIIIRGDGGFCRWKMMRWCDRHGVYYLLGLPRNAVLERLALPWTVAAQWHHHQTDDKVRLFGVVSYAAKTWDRPRRVVVKAEHDTHGPNPRFVVTNLPGDPHELYDQVYCQRGEMENRIKEQQMGLFADRTSCHRMVANQLRLMLSSAAYVLMQTLRRIGLAGTEFAQAQVTTIRVKLLKIAARVKVSVRRIVFHLATSCPYQSLFRHAAQRLAQPLIRHTLDTG